jgi:deoxyribose-phosphate aldolase
LDLKRIASALDVTVLHPCTTKSDVITACDEAIKIGAATLCVPPVYVRDAVKHADGKITVSSVVGFPNGYSTMSTKLFEAKNLVDEGAGEIDMVINIGYVKDGNFQKLFSEISSVKGMIGSDIVLKVIIETAYLTDDEKKRMCRILNETGADFCKTSTAFAPHGAQESDITLLRENLNASVKIKASGGINTLELAQKFLDLGADRIGSTKLMPLLKY